MKSAFIAIEIVACAASVTPVAAQDDSSSGCQIQNLFDPAWDVIELGLGVAAGGGRLAVGVPADFDVPSRMAAFLFAQHAGVWQREQVISGSDAAPGDFFGRSVALDGDTLLVGAPSTINDPEIEGALFVFERQPDGNWLETAKLRGGNFDFDPTRIEQFAWSLAIDGDTIVAGTPNDIVNGARSGSAYVFERDPNVGWRRAARLLATDASGLDKFGESVAVAGDLIVVGAPQDDPLGFASGSAYVFERDVNGRWLQCAKLIPGDHGRFDEFGSAVAVDAGRTILVGARHAPSADVSPGAVYAFEPDGLGTWREIQKLTPPNGENSDFFGISVALGGTLALFGAENYGNTFFGFGAAFVYVQQPDRTWTPAGILMPADRQDNSKFGRTVSINGNIAVVGAPFHDREANDGSNAGDAYIFAVGPDRDDNGVMDVCECRGAVGGDPGPGGEAPGFVASPDLDIDKRVGLGDLVILLNHFGDTGVLHEAGDLDLDRDVDLQDLALLLAAYDKPCE